MKKLLLIIVLSLLSIQSFAGSCPDGSEPTKKISADGTYFEYKCNNNKTAKTKRGEAYETAIIDQIIGLEKVFGTEAIEAILRKPTEVDGKPDAIVRIYDQVINIEAKMSNAQYSSVTFAVDKKTGKFVIKKDYSFNEQILPLGKAVQERIKVVRARLAEEGYSWDDITVIPTHLYDILLKEPVTIDGVTYNSHINALSAEMEVELDVVSEIYNKKKYATTDGKPNVLIDDYIKNINEWEKKGGIGVHHTEVGKTLAELKRLGFK